MKYQLAALAMATSAAAFAPSNNAFGVTSSATRSRTSLNMVLEAPKKVEKKLSKIEVLKTKSNHLTDPLKEVSW